MAKRTRRTPEQMIEDLQAKIEQVKARAERAKAKKNPAVRHVNAALRAIDKAAAESSDKAIREGLGEARATLVACLELAGASPEKGVLKPQPRREPVDPDAVLRYLGKHPGSSGEDVASALGTDTKSLRPAMKKLIAEKRVKTKGKARGMRYAAV